MRSPAPALAAAACLGALIAAAPAVARSKPKIPTSATYNVTFKAAMEEKWSSLSDYADDCELTGAMCTRVTKGDGRASIQLHTRGPQSVWVLRGYKGRPPSLNTGTDGLAVTGSDLRMGALTTEYGGPWDAANPDTALPATGCGNRSATTTVTFGWIARNRLQPVLAYDGFREDCPDGPQESLTWDGGASPSLFDVVARLDQKKFLHTKQFTARGSRTWTGHAEPFSRSDSTGHYTISGEKTVTWHWEATFRMKGAKKRHR